MRKYILSLLLMVPLMLLAQETPVKAVAGETVKVPCSQIDSMIAFSKTKLGCKYKYAGSGPDIFDCSGFTMFVYGHFGVELPHGSSSQFLLGRKVKRQDIRPGDLLFFNRSKGIGHAAMVTEVDSTGRVTFIHASTYRTGVKIDYLESAHYANTYAGARRIFECEDDSSYLLAYTDEDVAAIEKASTIPQPATDSYYYHKVKRGETLSSIARKYGTNIVSIKNWNNLRSDNIREGQALKIYRKTPTPAKKTNIETSTPVTEEQKIEKTNDNAAEVPVANQTNSPEKKSELSTKNEIEKGKHASEKKEEKKEVTETKNEPTDTKPAVKKTEQEYTYHTISKGESLYSIARKYNTTIEKLQEWNNLPSPDKITAGQKLKIRNNNTPAAPQKTETVKKNDATPSTLYHTVQKGESLGRIAAKYHTTIEKIMEWNHLSNPDKIAEGQKLKIIK